MKTSKSVIVTAGGIGKRMGSEIPKQFLVLENKVILMHAIECFYSAHPSIQIIVALPTDWIAYWKDLCKKCNFSIKHQLVSGGTERFHSIQNALQFASGEYVAIHDGVRPLVSKVTIERCFESAENFGNCIPVLPISDSIRRIKFGKTKAVSRSEYLRVQTPQVFKTELIKKAYLQAFSADFTDDASVLEATGELIHTVFGNEENIKITNPIDLQIASVLIQK